MTEDNISATNQLGGSYSRDHYNVECHEQESAAGGFVKIYDNLEVMHKDGNTFVDIRDATDCGFDRGSDSGQPLPGSYSFSDDELRITWMDGSQTTNLLGDLIVIDRGFLIGDVVTLASDTEGQLGKVMNINIIVDLMCPTGDIIENVSSRDLRRVRDFIFGDYVVNGIWVGQVEDVLDDVTVLLDDGSILMAMDAHASVFKPVSKRVNEYPSFPYYPGLRVMAPSPSVFDNTALSELWKGNNLEGTVTQVRAGTVFVHWIAPASPSFGSDFSGIPPRVQISEDLTLLSSVIHTKWKLGDCCMLKVANTCTIGNSTSRTSKESHHHKLQGQKVIKTTADEDATSSKKCFETCSQHHLVNDELVSHHLKNFFISEPLCMPKEDRTHQGGVADFVLNENAMPGVNESVRSVIPSSSSEDDFFTSSDIISIQPTCDSGLLCKSIFFKQGENKQIHKREENLEKAYVITNKKTKVDIMWQDGTREFDLDSVMLVPVDTLGGNYELFPEQYVKESVNDCDTTESKRTGIVRSMNSKERTVHVKWLKPSGRCGQYLDAITDELVSVYQLSAYPEYDYFYGDVIARLPPFPLSTSADSTISEKLDDEEKSEPNQVKPDIGNMQGVASNEPPNFDGHPAENVSGISCFGHVINLKDGDIEVEWGDGMVSKVWPEEELFLVGHDTGGEALVGESDLINGFAWENTEGIDIVAGENVGEDCSLPHPCETSTPGGGSSTYREEVDELKGCKDTNDKLLERILPPPKSDFEKDYGVQTTSATAEDQSITAILGSSMEIMMEGEFKSSEMSSDASVGIKSKYGTDNLHEPRQFDIAEVPIDHFHYSSKQVGGRKWVKRIQQEWGILANDLPDGIFVEVFEDRIDLLRAAIVGAYGTPYQEGLFFFDFALPPEFPEVPPMAYYHSRGLRMNPNLYEDGNVCLSLLNTWEGRGNELWEPSSSSILQVLVSLQGLVLNSKPYFNEPGYEHQMGSAEGERNSLSYNEHTFLLNLRSMIYIIQKPPMHFEELVKDHFQRRGFCILRTCDAYLKRKSTESTQDVVGTDQSSGEFCSVGFKLMLAKILPKLITALNDLGLDCSEFAHLSSFDVCL